MSTVEEFDYRGVVGGDHIRSYRDYWALLEVNKAVEEMLT